MAQVNEIEKGRGKPPHRGVLQSIDVLGGGYACWTLSWPAKGARSTNLHVRELPQYDPLGSEEEWGWLAINSRQKLSLSLSSPIHNNTLELTVGWTFVSWLVGWMDGRTSFIRPEKDEDLSRAATYHTYVMAAKSLLQPRTRSLLTSIPYYRK